MKKYDMKTRQGRARRVNRTGQFNPDTLQPHTRDSEVSEHRRDVKAAKRVDKTRRWAKILHG